MSYHNQLSFPLNPHIFVGQITIFLWISYGFPGEIPWNHHFRLQDAEAAAVGVEELDTGDLVFSCLVNGVMEESRDIQGFPNP